MAAIMLDHCAINGDIGSGKTSVAKILGQASGREIVSAGSILRETAVALGITALEVNRIAEQDERLDIRIDQILLELGESKPSLIFDSRVAWYILPSVFKVHLIVDNYGTHTHPNVQAWLAEHPRFTLHFVPTSSSWLNLVERWFGELTSKKLRRGTHHSVRELNNDIRSWINDWNENPRPYVWTKTADQILESISRYCNQINASGH